MPLHQSKDKSNKTAYLLKSEIQEQEMQTYQMSLGTVISFYFGGLLIFGSVAKPLMMAFAPILFPIFGVLNLGETSLKSLDAYNKSEYKVFNWLNAAVAMVQTALIITGTILALAHLSLALAAIAPFLFIAANALGAVIEIGKTLYHAYKWWRATDEKIKAKHKMATKEHLKASAIAVTGTLAIAALMVIPGAAPIVTLIAATILISFGCYLVWKLWKNRNKKEEAPALPASTSKKAELPAPAPAANALKSDIFYQADRSKHPDLLQKDAQFIKKEIEDKKAALTSLPAQNNAESVVEKIQFLNKLLAYINYLADYQPTRENMRFIESDISKHKGNWGDILRALEETYPNAFHTSIHKSDVKDVFDAAREWILWHQQEKDTAPKQSTRSPG